MLGTLLIRRHSGQTGGLIGIDVDACDDLLRWLPQPHRPHAARHLLCMVVGTAPALNHSSPYQFLATSVLSLHPPLHTACMQVKIQLPEGCTLSHTTGGALGRAGGVSAAVCVNRVHTVVHYYRKPHRTSAGMEQNMLEQPGMVAVTLYFSS